MSQVTADQKASVFRFTTSRIVIAAVLVALIIVMGLVPFLGFIPIPFIPGDSMTTEQIPVILGSVFEGPLVGMVTGLAWGIIALFDASRAAAGPFTAAFHDPAVMILPRIVVGVTPWLVFGAIMRAPFRSSGFTLLKRIQLDIASGTAGVVGAVTNTILFIGIAVARGDLAPVYFKILAPQAVIEAVMSAILTILVARVVWVARHGIIRAPDPKKREEMPY